MTKRTMKSQKGISRSGVRLLERALSLGYQPGPTSNGPAGFLRTWKQNKRRR